MAYIRKKNNKAQTALEYALLVACLVAALLAMQIYTKRAMQGNLRRAADGIGAQYKPKDTAIDSTTIYNTSEFSLSTPKTEKELGIDLNGDGKITDDVWATETTNELLKSNATEERKETVGKFEKNLFE